MKTNKNKVLIIYDKFDKNVGRNLPIDYEKFFIIYSSINDTFHNLCTHRVGCMIVYLAGLSFNLVHDLKRQFKKIPFIAIVPNNAECELIRKCGEIGIEKVIKEDESYKIQMGIVEMFEKCRTKPKLLDFDIASKNLCFVTSQALQIMENEFTGLSGIQEISDRLKLTNSTLSAKFKKNNIMSPKKLLVLFKVNYAMRLMENQGLTLKEICSLSGFGCPKLMIQNFQKLFNTSPQGVRKNINQYSIKRLIRGNE